MSCVCAFLTEADVEALTYVKAMRVKVRTLWLNLHVWTPASLRRLRLLREQVCQEVKHYAACTDLNTLKDLTRLTHLIFDNKFDSPVDMVAWPTTLTHLTFGTNFNHPLPKLPDRLERLVLGNAFNHPLVEGVLKAGLTHLTLGYALQHPLVEGVLPDSLTHLRVGSRDTPILNKIEKKLPESLICLTKTIGYDHHDNPFMPNGYTVRRSHASERWAAFELTCTDTVGDVRAWCSSPCSKHTLNVLRAFHVLR